MLEKWKKRKNGKTCFSGVNGRSRSFHMPKILEIANFNSLQKVHDFRFLGGTVHVIVDGAVSSNPLTV